MALDYRYGDIVDARNSHLKHFLLVVGEVEEKNEMIILYYLVSSRFYRVFPSLIDFFNRCINDNYRGYKYHFPKEKQKAQLGVMCPLADTFFLDRNNYAGFLDTDSVIFLNQDPTVLEKNALEQMRTDGQARYSTRLCKADVDKFIQFIRHSPNISSRRIVQINTCLNQYKKGLRSL